MRWVALAAALLLSACGEEAKRVGPADTDASTWDYPPDGPSAVETADTPTCVEMLPVCPSRVNGEQQCGRDACGRACVRCSREGQNVDMICINADTQIVCVKTCDDCR